MRPMYLKENSLPDKAVYTTRAELLYFLRFLVLAFCTLAVKTFKTRVGLNFWTYQLYIEKNTNPTIQKFLNHDTSFCLADKYLIAMVFIYFKRAELSPEDYTYLNFFAGLCLAHSMEEDIELSSEIYPWALGNELKNELPRLLELKTLLWMAMDYRAAVSQHCCKQLISISANHPVWRRERSPFYLTRFLSIEAANRDFPDYLTTPKNKAEERRHEKFKKRFSE